MSATAYPLCWPAGWPRTPHRVRAGSKFRGVTFERARRGLQEEVRRLGGHAVVLSTNQPVRQDGAPYAATRLIHDPGVAIYFTRGGAPVVMARDAYTEIAANLRSLAMAIEHLRGLDRHGGGVMVEKAFTGFLALPAPGDSPDAPRPWRDVLEISGDPNLIPHPTMVEAAFRVLARRLHPDVPGTGSSERFQELVDARAAALAELESQASIAVKWRK